MFRIIFIFNISLRAAVLENDVYILSPLEKFEHHLTLLLSPISAEHRKLVTYIYFCESTAALLFCSQGWSSLSDQFFLF